MSARRSRSPRAPSFYTTHQAAGLLGVSLATVVNWVNQGRLSAHRTPGGHRRIGREELARFCRANDYPLPPELQGVVAAEPPGPPRVLVVHGDRAFAELVRDFLTLDGEVEVLITDRALEAGFLVSAGRPRVILLDLELPEVPARQLAGLLARLEPRPVLVGCVTMRGAGSQALLDDGTLPELVERSTPVAEVARRLRGLLGT